MADDIIDAHEQSEQARKWLQQNGSSIVVGVLLGLAVLLGWQRWQQSSVNHRAEAMVKFEDLQAAVDKKDDELAGKLVEDLRKNFGDTPHAALASLEHAESLVKAGKLEEAEAMVRFAVDKGVPESVQSVARLRLARLMLARGQAQAAIDVLKDVKLEGFEAQTEGLRGDALMALGKPDDARKAYDLALAATDVASSSRRMLEIKRDDLAAGAAPPAPAASVPPAAEPAAPAVVREKPAEQDS